MFTKEDLYKAYYDCRKHKRGTYNALAFEINQEEALDKLYNELKNGTIEVMKTLSPEWGKYIYLTGPCQKVVIRNKYKKAV